jgi:hypothetical protein
MTAVYQAAEYILCLTPRPVFIDGRTFSKPGQIEEASALATELYITLRVIECVCAEEVACARIEGDHAAGSHLAGNRTPELYARAKANAVPLTIERLTLDTGALTLEECVRRAVEYLG